MQTTDITKKDIDRAWTLEGTLNFTRYFFKHLNKRRFIVGNHHKTVCQALDDVLQGKTTKLIINIAPRYGKTELAVKNFIAMGLAINPRANFIHLSYSGTLAMENSMAIKDIVKSEEYQRLFKARISYGNDTKNKWKTEQGGGLYATSTLGQITGFGAGLVEQDDGSDDDDMPTTIDDETAETTTDGELAEAIEEIEPTSNMFGGAIVIDDPIKPEDALSDVIRERVNRRFETTIRNRVNSRKTPIIIIMQRLHENDLCGYLQNIEPDDWKVVSLPCVYEDEEGETHPLWEFKHTLLELEKIRLANAFVYETQYMQNPKPLEGLMYTRFNTYATMPIEAHLSVKKAYIDTADTGSDYLCAIFYDEFDSGCYVTDVIYTQKPMEYTEPETARAIERNGTTECAVESNNGGRGFRRNVEKNVRQLGNWRCNFIDLTQTQNKQTRIFTHSAEVQNMLYFPEDWATRWPAYYSAMTAYRKEGKNEHDDAPDATTGVVERFQTITPLTDEEIEKTEEAIY